MSSKTTPQLFIGRVDKGDVNETALFQILEQDSDFFDNEEYFREDTLSLGFKNEAERVSKEIFEKFKSKEDSSERLELMVKELFNVNNFIGKSSNYGRYEFQIVETDFEFIVVIATTI